MRPRHLIVPVVVLLAGLVLWSPAPADAQPGVPCTECSCNTACSMLCYYPRAPFEWCLQHMDYPDLCYTDCQDRGLCTTSPQCEPSCQNLSCTTTTNGTTGNDMITGTSAPECIYADHGNDVIDGGPGDDRLYGGSGNDDLFGDSGNDCMWGGTEDDFIDGESGYDFGDGEIGTLDSCSAATETQVNC